MELGSILLEWIANYSFEREDAILDRHADGLRYDMMAGQLLGRRLFDVGIDPLLVGRNRDLDRIHHRRHARNPAHRPFCPVLLVEAMDIAVELNDAIFRRHFHMFGANGGVPLQLILHFVLKAAFSPCHRVY